MSLAFIFAHPDDESFGPGGTIVKFAEKKDVYLICVTNGNDTTKAYDMGITEKGLTNIRKSELRAAAKKLGAKKVYFLDYEDGSLSNDMYHEVAGKIEKILKRVKPTEIMTFEPRGVSGHLDHIAVSMITTFVFKKLKFIKKLYYYCLNRDEREEVEDYFIYFPPGYKSSEIDLTIDVKKYWNKKIEAVLCHKSQIDKAEDTIEWMESLPKKEHFLVMKNN